MIDQGGTEILLHVQLARKFVIFGFSLAGLRNRGGAQTRTATAPGEEAINVSSINSYAAATIVSGSQHPGKKDQLDRARSSGDVLTQLEARLGENCLDEHDLEMEEKKR